MIGILTVCQNEIYAVDYNRVGQFCNLQRHIFPVPEILPFLLCIALLYSTLHHFYKNKIFPSFVQQTVKQSIYFSKAKYHTFSTIDP